MAPRWQRGSESSQKVLVPPKRHISSSFQDIVDKLAEHNEHMDVEQYRHIAEQLDFATLHDFQIVRRRLKQGFKPFNDAALQQNNTTPGNWEAETNEVDFLEDLFTLLKAAHFSVLSHDEWEAAVHNDFTFTNPMDVAWASMDQTMLSKFWKQRPEEYKNAAALSDRVLIMHRGIKLSHATGKFFQEKVDLLVEYLVVNPLEQYVQPTLKKYKIAWKDYYPTIEVVEAKDLGLHKAPDQDAYKLPRRSTPMRDPLLDHDNARWVKRQTLKNAMPNCSAVFSQFFKEVRLQEPTFRDAIILYRRIRHRSSGSDKPQEDRGRNIYIKRFRDIPNADLEMVFPDKTVYLKPVLLIQLMFTIILGLISVFVTIITNEASWSVLGGILSVVGTRAYQVYCSATLGRQKVLDDITDRLYDQTMDAQDGVIYFLLDQMADQHVKEVLLAYFLLLDAKRPMSQKQLDKRCEDFLQFQFGERVDFALENSLPALLEDGLIQRDGQGLLIAVPLEEARKILAKKGATFFEEHKRHFKSNIPTFARLSSSASKKNARPSAAASAVNSHRPPRAPVQDIQRRSPLGSDNLAPSHVNLDFGDLNRKSKTNLDFGDLNGNLNGSIAQRAAPSGASSSSYNTSLPAEGYSPSLPVEKYSSLGSTGVPLVGSGSYSQGIGAREVFTAAPDTSVGTKPTIEYEEDEPTPDVPSYPTPSYLGQETLTIPPLTGQLRPRTGHQLEFNPSERGSGAVGVAPVAEESRL